MSFKCPNPASKSIAHQSKAPIWKTKFLIYHETGIKFIYLICATVITISIIVECILIHLVIIPYEYEAGFFPIQCLYIKSTLVSPMIKCENKCSKDRSGFQCVQIQIVYSKAEKNFTALLFDNIATYQYYHLFGVINNSLM